MAGSGEEEWDREGVGGVRVGISFISWGGAICGVLRKGEVPVVHERSATALREHPRRESVHASVQGVGFL